MAKHYFILQVLVTYLQKKSKPYIFFKIKLNHLALLLVGIRLLWECKSVKCCKEELDCLLPRGVKLVFQEVSSRAKYQSNKFSWYWKIGVTVSNVDLAREKILESWSLGADFGSSQFRCLCGSAELARGPEFLVV
jgi:hypothetical protein